MEYLIECEIEDCKFNKDGECLKSKGEQVGFMKIGRNICRYYKKKEEKK